MIVGLDNIGDIIIDSEHYTSDDNTFYAIEMRNSIADEIYISKTGDITNTSKKDWVLDTYLKARFQNDLEAGNIGLAGSPVDRWKIKRRRKDSTKFDVLNTISAGVDENFYYLDTTPRSNVIYEYDVIPMSGDIEGVPQTVQIKVEFDYWWLLDDNEQYPFIANLQINDITHNQQRQIYTDGFSKFPIVNYGMQEYQSGSISAILLDAYGVVTREYRDKVVDFINNHKPKYLKSAYGDIWIVDTHTARRNVMFGSYMDTANSYDVSTITFEWTEIDKIND